MRISDWSSDVCSSDLPDRDAHQIVGDAERLLAAVRYRQMRHRGGVAGQRLGAAEADRELGDPERIEKGETLLLAALDVEREGRARAGAVAAEDIGDRKSTRLNSSH